MTRAVITSIHNERLKAVRRLQRVHEPRRVFLVEGYRQLRRALEAGARVCEIYTAPELYLGSDDAALVSLAERRGARVFELGRRAYESISSHVRPDGIIAIVERWSTPLEGTLCGARPLLVVAEAVERPGNLGTVIRAACAAGSTGLVVCGGRTDVFHPETVRGSVGTLFHLPIAQATTADTVRWVRARGVRIVVATPAAQRAHWEADYTSPVAIVLGSERHGVTDAWLTPAGEEVCIPMPGPANSLNVAIAAGVVLFEATRQRMLAAGRCPRPPVARGTWSGDMPG